MTSIESGTPSDWKGLQAAVGRILQECGLEVQVEYVVRTVRGPVEIDVWSRERTATSRHTTFYECKLWRTRVPQEKVHAFRTVVADGGANAGVLLCDRGFQAGAFSAAELTNVELLTWEEFQERWAGRWFREYFVRKLLDHADPLVEYTEPINSRIARRMGALAPAAQARVRELVREHEALGWLIASFRHSRLEVEQVDSLLPPVSLPLRRGVSAGELRGIPSAVLDATGLRDLLTALLDAAHIALAQFDPTFGGRA